MNPDYSDPVVIRKMGFHNGLMSAADFISSGWTFDRWYGEGPYDIDRGWFYLLEAMGRVSEFHELQVRLDKQRTGHDK